MKKSAYAKYGCELCGGYTRADDQEIHALVGKSSNAISEALYVCSACIPDADKALDRLAKKLNTETCLVRITGRMTEDSRASMSRGLLHLLNADSKANTGLLLTPKDRTLRNRLYSRFSDLQIINVGFNLQFPTSEGAFTDRVLDTILKLTLLKQIMLSPEYHSRRQCDVAVVSAYFSVPSMSYEPVRGDAVAISLQLAYLINGWGEGVVDVAMKLQAKGLSPFKAVEQCVNILAKLDFSLIKAEDYAENYPAVRKTLKL